MTNQSNSSFFLLATEAEAGCKQRVQTENANTGASEIKPRGVNPGALVAS